MKIPVYVAALGISMFAPFAYGNGGTFNTTDVKATGNLVPQRKDRIVLDKELLNIRLAGDEAQVDVTYTLRNTGGRDTVTYGFPIDLPTGSGDDTSDKAISGYSIEDGGKKLAVSKVIKKFSASGTEQPYGQSVRNWYMTDIEFSKGETKTLHVSYTTKVLGTVSGTSKQAFWQHSPLTFLYTLKPSQSWGNGKVGQLDIIADVSEIKKVTDKIHVELPGAASVGSGNEIAWHLKNYDLRNSPDLTLTYDNSIQLTNEDVMGRLLPRKYIESIRASSTHTPSTKGFTYNVNNLLDGKLDTAWISGTPGPGIGEWIEITFKDNVELEAIEVINGYCKSQDSLDENGEVLQMDVEIYDRAGREIKFVDTMQGLVKLERTKYSDALVKFTAGSAQEVFDAGDGTPVKKVRLKITGAENGTKYAQAAISELFICGHSVKK